MPVNAMLMSMFKIGIAFANFILLGKTQFFKDWLLVYIEGFTIISGTCFITNVSMKFILNAV